MTAPAASALVRLLRLPSVLTVPGDVLVGAVWSGDDDAAPAPAVLVLSSSLTYLAGMALNDWADREQDAHDRPGRPIPAGEVRAGHALMLAVALSAGGLVAARAGGSRALRVAAPLTVTLGL